MHLENLSDLPISCPDRGLTQLPLTRQNPPRGSVGLSRDNGGDRFIEWGSDRRSMFNNEANDVMLKLVASHSDLRDAIEDEDREEALRATKTAALLGMRFMGLIPNLDKIGIKHLTADEMSQMKKKLNSLLS